MINKIALRLGYVEDQHHSVLIVRSDRGRDTVQELMVDIRDCLFDMVHLTSSIGGCPQGHPHPELARFCPTCGSVIVRLGEGKERVDAALEILRDIALDTCDGLAGGHEVQWNDRHISSLYDAWTARGLEFGANSLGVQAEVTAFDRWLSHPDTPCMEIITS
jgi:hypothetical protein